MTIDLFQLSMTLSSADNEGALLGCIIQRPAAFDSISDILSAEDFIYPVHGRIFSEMRELQKQNIETNPFALNAKIESDEEYKKLGGIKYLFSLVSGAISVINLIDYARQIANYSLKRKAINVILESAESLQENKFFDFIDSIDAGITKLTERTNDRSERDLKKIKESILEELDMKIKNKGSITGLRTGIAQLDNKIGGFQKGNLYILAGRPAMGKSAMMATMCRSILNNGHKVGILSMEMTSEQYTRRIAVMNADIPYEKIDRGNVAQSDLEKFMNGIDKINGLFISDKVASVAYTRSFIRRLVRQKKIDCFFIDHIGLTQFGNEYKNRVIALGEFTIMLKTLSKELNIPIIALCQINRGVEKQEDKRPTMADLRDSGMIEENADVCLLLYRQEYYLEKSEPVVNSKEWSKWDEDFRRSKGWANIIIGKNRHGECSNIPVRFDAPKMFFYDQD